MWCWWTSRASEPLPDRYGPGEQAALVHRLVRELDLPRLTLVGHSLGGGIALLTALRLLDDPGPGATPLRRLVLVAAAAYRQKLPPFAVLGRWPRTSLLLLRALGVSNVIRWTLRSIVYDPEAVTAGQVAGYAGPLDTPGGRRSLVAAAGQVVPPDLDELTARYPEIEVPTLLLWGREDPVVPLWVARRLEAELPRARLEILERCGHSPPDELPQRSLAGVTRFLDAHPSPPGDLTEGDAPGPASTAS